MDTIIKAERFIKTVNSTISKAIINNKRYYFLEDRDRGLTSAMPLSEINAKKVKAQTAIPSGRYEIIISWSNNFKQFMPLLLGVKGFEGIRIHSGNTANDSEGCLLTGLNYSTDFVGSSRTAYKEIFAYLQKACKTGKVFIEIA